MQDRWRECVVRLEARLPPQQFKPWIKPLIFIGYEESEHLLRLGVANPQRLNWVRNQFEPLIAVVIRELFDPDTRLQFELVRAEQLAESGNGQGNGSAEPAEDPDLSEPSADTGRRARIGVLAANGLRPDLSFDTFVNGKANQIAVSAAMQVVEQPGTAYNPLFIYAGTGLGKTHLMHAIGNALVHLDQDIRMLYVSAQDYFDEMFRAIQRKNTQEFKRKYQHLDLLLVDDIQFLSGKERTQEEFFFAFDSLITARKQLIITCDTYPRDLSKVQDRLLSRLGSGLIVEIEPPELEMRVAILLRKAEAVGVALPDDVAFLIAKNLRSNVRELEGALNRVIAFARFRETRVDLELAREALKDLFELNRPPVSIDRIQRSVAEQFGIKVADMFSKRRPANIARARQVAMYFAKELTQKSFPEIGEAFGGRDHTTVMHAVKRVAELRQHDTEFNRQLHLVEQALRA
ncbi:MAG: chromosomal replication initiator protein DnaA [Burkholderiaceae bacterium]|nr:chromosomal replication initiator protein DnaA [Burkholderiaceae bacterium]